MMRRVARLVVPATVVFAATAAPAHPSPQTVGEWLAPFSEDGNGDGYGDFDARPPQNAAESARLAVGVNAAVLPDGRVLYWSQLDGTERSDPSLAFQRPDPTTDRTRVLDLSASLASGTRPAADDWSVPTPEDGGGGSFVGSEQRALPDGRVIAIGGTDWRNDDAQLGLPDDWGRTELYGLRATRIFDPATRRWTQAGSMRHGRYYPTLVTLPDGSLQVFGGASKLVYNTGLVPAAHPPDDALPRNVQVSERFDVATGTWAVDGRAGARTVLPLFARLHLLPDGTLLYPAAGMLYAPGGGDVEAEAWNVQKTFDPVRGSWTEHGHAPLGVRSNAFSVLLPLRPPYNQADVLVGGGTLGPWPSGYVATPLTEVVSWHAGRGLTRSFGAPLTTARWHSSAVVLPSGEVIALSGADRDEVVDPGSAIAVRHAEMFDPRTGEWTRLAAAARDRTIHNTAVLLRDGSILVGGHAPAPAHYGTHANGGPPFASNFKDPSFEIFRPPYLFRGTRPTIESVSTRTLSANGTFTITTPDARDPSLRVVLSRLPATTHINDSDQRTVELRAVAFDDDGVRSFVPRDAVLPPGHYYLFILKDNGSGPTPSVAEIVQVT